MKHEGVDFSQVNELKASKDNFYKDVLSYYIKIIRSVDRFNLYFLEEKKVDIENFSERSFYKNKIDRVRKSFELMHGAMNFESHSERIRNNTLEITDLLKKENISQGDVFQIEKMINELKLKREVKIEFNRMNEFIEDGLKHLPTIYRDQNILSNYEIKNDIATLVTAKRYSVKRISGGNHIYLDTSQDSSRIVHFGHMPFKLCGRGYREVWKKSELKWSCVSAKPTWMS
ncbi:hypothetical protein OAP32_00180 [Crocinitomicaceae bacterium]|nr:hypothetical protein [Crocinitomicaceae bacterium]